MLDPVETLFLNRSYKPAVNDNRRRGVAMVGIDAEYSRSCSR